VFALRSEGESFCSAVGFSVAAYPIGSLEYLSFFVPSWNYIMEHAQEIRITTLAFP